MDITSKNKMRSKQATNPFTEVMNLRLCVPKDLAYL